MEGAGRRRGFLADVDALRPPQQVAGAVGIIHPQGDTAARVCDAAVVKQNRGLPRQVLGGDRLVAVHEAVQLRRDEIVVGAATNPRFKSADDALV